MSWLFCQTLSSIFLLTRLPCPPFFLFFRGLLGSSSRFIRLPDACTLAVWAFRAYGQGPLPMYGTNSDMALVYTLFESLRIAKGLITPGAQTKTPVSPHEMMRLEGLRSTYQ